MAARPPKVPAMDMPVTVDRSIEHQTTMYKDCFVELIGGCDDRQGDEPELGAVLSK
jgi:hypothetical protein